MPAYTVPAIRGRMGSTEYFQAVMSARELAATVHAAIDFPEFEDFLESERMQRALSEERVEREIVPYLTRSKDRFFGSVIVLVYQPEEFNFETLADLGLRPLGAPYKRVAEASGALTISGGKLFALDGQHRLHALRTVINGGTTPRLKLPVSGPFAREVRDDLLSVIFIPYESNEKARRIFTKVNRYAKPTTKATNILMSEDDGHAIIARCLGSFGDPFDFDSEVAAPFPHLLRNGCKSVQSRKNSLVTGDNHLTTLEVLYNTVPAICAVTNRLVLDEKTTVVRPEDADLRVGFEDCASWWGELLSGFEPFVIAISNRFFDSSWREHDEVHSLAYRPAGQEALVRGLMLAHELSGLRAATLVGRLNSLDWCIGGRFWAGVFLGGGEKRRRILTKNTSLAARLIAYCLVGPNHFGARRTHQLFVDYQAAKQEYGIRVSDLPRTAL